MNPSVWIDILITMFKNLPKNKVKRMLPNALLSGIERTFLKKCAKNVTLMLVKEYLLYYLMCSQQFLKIPLPFS